jgi:hypothetical protein
VAVSIGGAVTQLFDLQTTGLEDQSAAATATAQGLQSGAQGAVANANANAAVARANSLDYTEAGVRLQQQGDYAEAASYGNAADIATNSATLADVAGQVQEYQNTRAVNATVGSQRASVAAAGLSNSGSALALARSSFQQGYLQNQMTRIQSLTREGGFLEEAAAARAEQQAATTAGDIAGTTIGAYEGERTAYQQEAAGAQATAQGYQAQQAAYNQVAANYGTMSSQATVQAASMSRYLSSYLSTQDMSNPENQMAAALLSGSSGSGWSVSSTGQLSYNGTAITGLPGTSGTSSGSISGSGGATFNGQNWVQNGQTVQLSPLRNLAWGVH